MDFNIELVSKTDNDNFLDYYIINHTNKELEVSYWRELEIYINNNWYLYSHLPWILSSEIIPPNSSLYVDDSWITAHCSIVKGKYRIILNMDFKNQYYTNDMFSDQDDCFYLAYEFLIN